MLTQKRRAFIQHWWKYKLVQLLWKSVQRFIKKKKTTPKNRTIYHMMQLYNPWANSCWGYFGKQKNFTHDPKNCFSLWWYILSLFSPLFPSLPPTLTRSFPPSPHIHTFAHKYLSQIRYICSKALSCCTPVIPWSRKRQKDCKSKANLEHIVRSCLK